MSKHNNGIGKSNVLQNQFTAYLTTAIYRRKILYLQEKTKQKNYEMAMELKEYKKELQIEQDMLGDLSILEQINNPQLLNAIAQIKERDLQILYMRAIEDLSLNEISNIMGIKYKTIGSIYYRLLDKLKESLGGEDK